MNLAQELFLSAVIIIVTIVVVAELIGKAQTVFRRRR
jgi:hypothetical protein